MLVFDDKPEIIEVSRSQRINISSSSKGNQLKWFADNKFIKLNTYTWYEDISEVLVSHLLSFTNIKSYLKYYHCIIVEDDVKLGDGCYSYNYLSAEQRDISFYRLFKRNGFDIGRMSYDDVRETLYNITGVDYKPYIDSCLCVDAMTYNEDRHFNNLSVVAVKDKYSFAPLYDFGLSCLADTITYPVTESVESCVERVLANPFKSSFIYQLQEARVVPILLDYNSFLNSVGELTGNEQRALEVIKLGVERTRGVAWTEF